MRLLGRKPAYKGTISGLRISAVDGTAFIDACAAITAYADGNHRIEIYDSANKMLAGFLKAQGSGETFGSELVSNGDFETGDFTGWSSVGLDAEGINAVSPLAGSYDYYMEVNTGPTGLNQHIYQKVASASQVGKLFKFATLINLVSGDNPRFIQYVGNAASISLPAQSFNGSLTVTTLGTHDQPTYYTDTLSAVNRYVCLGEYSANFVAYVDSVTLKQVTAPSANGATLVSTQSGTTYNFTFKDAGFAYNEASYRVIVREYA